MKKLGTIQKAKRAQNLVILNWENYFLTNINSISTNSNIISLNSLDCSLNYPCPCHD